VSDFTCRRGADPDRDAPPTPCRSARCPAWRASRRTRDSAVLLLGRENPGSRHARTSTKANHCDRPDGPVSLQPEPDLSGVLTVTAWYRDLGQQPVVTGHARWRGGGHPLGRYTERRGLLGTKIRCPVLGLQGLRAPLAVRGAGATSIRGGDRKRVVRS